MAKRDANYVFRNKNVQGGRRPYTARFYCVPCDMPFDFNPTLGKKVACPRCRGTRVAARSPGAKVTIGGNKPESRKTKQLKFMKRSARNLLHLREAKTSFLAFLKLLEVGQEDAQAVSNAMDAAIKVAENATQAKMGKY